MTHSAPSDKSPHTPDSPPPETLAIDIRGVLLVGAGLTLLVVVSLVGLYAWLEWRSSKRVVKNVPAATDDAKTASLPGEPGVDAHQKVERLKYEEQQEKLLTGYELVDPDTKVYRIPISRAMELIVERSKHDAKEEK